MLQVLEWRDIVGIGEGAKDVKMMVNGGRLICSTYPAFGNSYSWFVQTVLTLPCPTYDMYICYIRIYIYINIYIYEYIYIYVSVCEYTCIYIYIHIYIILFAAVLSQLRWRVVWPRNALDAWCHKFVQVVLVLTGRNIVLYMTKNDFGSEKKAQPIDIPIH